ncbi:hypothetical protein TSOC_011117, partial [Tetrabaena socialis]
PQPTAPSTPEWLDGATPSVRSISARSFKLLRAEGRRLGERRFAAAFSAVTLSALAFYGTDLISMAGRITRLPVEDIDGFIYFVIVFNVVSLVLPKSRYQ